MEKIKNFFFDSALKEKMNLLSNERDNTNSLNNILGDVIPYKDKNIYVADDVFTDLEFFQNYAGNVGNSICVFDAIDNTYLKGSKNVEKIILNSPIEEVSILNKRKKILFGIENNFVEEVRENFLIMKEYEDEMINVFMPIDPNLIDVYNSVYFNVKVFQSFNNKSGFLTGKNLWKIIFSPVMGIISPIIYFIIPYLIMRYKFKFGLSLSQYIRMMWFSMVQAPDMFINSSFTNILKWASWIFSIVFYFQGIINSFEIAHSLNKVSNHIIGNINNIITYLNSYSIINKILWNDNIFDSFIVKNDLYKESSEEIEYIESLNVKSYKLYNNFGHQLKTSKFLDKNIVKSILLKGYIIDSLLSFTQFKRKNMFNYCDFIQNRKKPLLYIKNFYHPSLSGKIVKNSIYIDGEKYPQNLIITGSNAAGKSTLIKSILINIILSQTITISNSSFTRLTPFLHINSQINIPDTKGYESLFEAEMFRSKRNLDLLKNLPVNKFSFVLMDEIFSSTNPIEGISGAYSIAKKMSDYDNSMMIFTTHYVYLTKLAKNTKKFKNYSMKVNITNNGAILFPYVLSKGISRQYIALELLKKNQFDEEIIETALSIKNNLLGSE